MRKRKLQRRRTFIAWKTRQILPVIFVSPKNAAKIKTNMAMDRRHRRVLQQNTVRLTNDLEPITLLGYLYQEGAILEDDMDRVRSKSERKLQAQELLRIIPKRGAKAFDRFCDVLYKIDGQRHLAKMLKEDIAKSKGIRGY